MDYTAIHNLNVSRLTLGTAQLGLNYGIANIDGKPDRQKANEVLKAAIGNGINCFDTALSYADSEAIIGSFLSSNSAESPVVVTKLPAINLNGAVAFQDVYHLVREQLTCSIKHLQMAKIPVYLLHRASDIISYEGLILKSLLTLQSEGLIGLLGVSIYTPEEVEVALKIEEIRAIQIPVNILDHRLITTGLLDSLKKKKFIVFVRSIFLQGLFFLNPDNLPSGLELAEKPLRQLQNLASEGDVAIDEMAFTFVRDLPGITSLVIGAETPAQVIRNIHLLKSPPLSSELREKIMDTFSELPVDLVNPSLWHVGDRP